MKEILYRYNTLGAYVTDGDPSFGGESHLKLIVEPHDFSITVGGETLRSTVFTGCTAVVSCAGEVVFYDIQGNEIGRADAGEGAYPQVRLLWQPESLSVQFGQIATVDHYPNCDGEYDRYSEEWVILHTVTLSLTDHVIKVD